MRLFKRTPFKEGQHVEVYKKSSKHFGKQGVIARVTMCQLKIMDDETGKDFPCSQTSTRRTMDPSVLEESEFAETLQDNPELYEAYRIFTDLMMRYNVDPRTKEFTDILIVGMLV